MTEFESQNPEFTIEVDFDGHSQSFQVKPEETSDGVSYYSCLQEGKTVTQLRTNEKGQWEQIWGKLSPQQVEALGAVLKKETYED
ncbi:hypothetical protein IWX76_001168 [Pedobacter sp. CAN_A7]|uniref:hypothetical protein n=1 Tax=Pedobacter sp. CAN_A7 TaxID=2787722 RepID=UPI0018C9974F